MKNKIWIMDKESIDNRRELLKLARLDNRERIIFRKRGDKKWLWK